MKNNNPPPIRQIKSALKKARKILVISHKKPDGDAFGAALGMARGLKKVGFGADVAVDFENTTGMEWMGLKSVKRPKQLKNPEKYSRLGAKIPRGVLLTGAPGNGKTLLARATAGEANCPFFSISGSDFIEVFVGVGAARVCQWSLGICLKEGCKAHTIALCV